MKPATIHWGLGYWCGMATMAALYLSAEGNHYWLSATGLAITLFFCDVLYAKRGTHGQSDDR